MDQIRGIVTRQKMFWVEQIFLVGRNFQKNNKNFNVFINEYRIKEAEKMLNHHFIMLSQK